MEDIEKMSSERVTGVLNVQTEIDMDHREVNWKFMVSTYEKFGIKAVHYPIHDFNAEDLQKKLYEGGKLLNKMINEEKLNVYVHCTAGMGRAPAIVVMYLCMFKGMQVEEADIYVK